MDGSVSQQVTALLTEVTDIPAMRIRSDSRLLEDLGLDGDDAVELFELFEQRFTVDLTALYANWPQHFGPEGLSLSIGFGILIVGVGVSLPLALLGLHQWLAYGAGVVCAGVWIWKLRCWPIRQPVSTPITVADLVRAVEAGRWAGAAHSDAPHGQAAP